MRLAMLIAALVSVLPLTVAALVGRIGTARRRRRNDRPRVVWGPVPLISIKYWSNALRARGYESTTRVHGVSHIVRGEDFDDVLGTVLGSTRLANVFWHHLSLGRALVHDDVFHCFLDGGFLRQTPIARLEGPLLKLGGKKLVVSPYGSDTAVAGFMPKLAEQRLFEDYPLLRLQAEKIRKTVDYYCRYADLVIHNYHWGYLPRWDTLWVTELAIDTDAWEAPGEPSKADGANGEVVVVHAPNHRRIKGSDELIAAIGELRAEGLEIRLELLEKRPNEELKQVVRGCDVVVDQIITGYAMFAIEGLAAGKPVISTLSWQPPEVRVTDAMRSCPIVDADIETIKERLRFLVTNPEERARIGAASREFALRYHSEQAVGETWDLLLTQLWEGEPVPAELPAATLASETLLTPAEAISSSSAS